MAWTNMVLVTNRNDQSPYQIRISCEGSDPDLIEKMLGEIANYLDTYYGNYTGEEYAALRKAQADRIIDMGSIG